MFYENTTNLIVQDTYRRWYKNSRSLINTRFAQDLASRSKIPLKTSETTVEEDIEKANPNRGYGNYTDNNCVGASLAYCLRRYGLDAQASAIPHGSSGDAVSNWLNWDIQKYSISAVCNDYGTDDASLALRREIRRNTSQKCGLLRVGFSPDGNAGHMMAWERLSDGEIVLLNPQDKTLDPHTWIWQNAKRGGIVNYDWTDGLSVDWSALEGGTGRTSEYGYCVERYRGS